MADNNGNAINLWYGNVGPSGFPLLASITEMKQVQILAATPDHSVGDQFAGCLHDPYVVTVVPDLSDCVDIANRCDDGLFVVDLAFEPDLVNQVCRDLPVEMPILLLCTRTAPTTPPFGKLFTGTMLPRWPPWPDRFVSWFLKPLTCEFLQTYIPKLFKVKADADEIRNQANAELSERGPCYDAFVLMGKYHLLLGHEDDALRCLLEAPRYWEGGKEAQFLLGQILSGKRAWEAAIACFEKAVALDPSYAAAHFALGLALVAAGRPAAARRAFERAIQCEDPDIKKSATFQLELMRTQ